MNEKKEKVIIITGAARGIGRDLVLLFINNGYKVAGGDIDYEGITTISKELVVDKKANFIGVDADISEPLQAEHLIYRAKKRFGRIDVLINNAAYVKKLPFLDYSPEEWKHIVDVSLNGYFFCSQAAAKEMIINNCGKIINIASIVGFVAHVGLMAYAVSKAGVIAMTKLMSHELRKYNISVNAVAPGPTDTPLMKAVIKRLSDTTEEGIQTIPSEAISKASNIASMVLLLVEDDLNIINGNVLNLGGGVIGEA